MAELWSFAQLAGSSAKPGSMSKNTKYDALGPIDCTSDDMCGCDSVGSIVLQDCLIPNPLYCGTCFGGVPPESIRLAGDLVTPIARWRDICRSLYLLWLDSGDYAAWASDQLENAAGQIHTAGRGIADQITAGGHLCYYRWFVPHSEVASHDCPFCGQGLEAWPDRADRRCLSCRVVL